MKKLICLVLCAALSVSFAGCGKGKKDKDEEYYETTLSFEKDGSITEVIVESFAEDYYSEEGLKAYFKEKISEFNSSNLGEGEIELGDIEVADKKATASMRFDSANTYMSFYGPVTFYGSLSDAYDAGYITETVLKSVDSSETINKYELMQKKDCNIIIVSEVVRVKAPQKIIYTSANVEVLNDKEVRISSDSTGNAYLLVK